MEIETIPVEMRRWALGLGIAGLVLALVGYAGIFQGFLAPFEALPLTFLGQASFAAAIVLAALGLIAKKITKQ